MTHHFSEEEITRDPETGAIIGVSGIPIELEMRTPSEATLELMKKLQGESGAGDRILADMEGGKPRCPELRR